MNRVGPVLLWNLTFLFLNNSSPLRMNPCSVQEDMGESFITVLIFTMYSVCWPITFCQAIYFLWYPIHGSIFYLSLLKESQLMLKLYMFYFWFYCFITWVTNWKHKIRICFLRFFFFLFWLLVYVQTMKKMDLHIA